MKFSRGFMPTLFLASFTVCVVLTSALISLESKDAGMLKGGLQPFESAQRERHNGRPVITSGTTASGTVGTAFSYQITATNNPTSYGATGLPTGLSVSSGSGLISGTPTAAGTSTVTLRATNASGTGTAALTLNITGPGTGQFMTLSADGSYLVNTITNEPVFITGDAPQTLAVQVDDADVVTYLADRASRQFNALWVLLTDNGDQTNYPDDYYGNPPFDGADFTNEDPAYWAHVDYVLQECAAYGMTVFANPGFVGLSGYYLNSYLDSSAATLTAYGQWLGNRYKNYPNIVWALGGDSNYKDSGLYAKINDLAIGIAESDPYHLITLEACPEGACGYGNTSTFEDWTRKNVGAMPTAMNLNWVYNLVQSVQPSCAFNYSTYSAPALIGEDWYEGEHSMTELQLREELYGGMLSGCTLGQLFGNNAIWTMGGPKDTMGETWQSQLGSQGSLNEEYNGQLMRSREFWKMVPDTSNAVLTGGIGSGTSISVASCTSDGQTCMVYDPVGNSQAPEIAMSHFSGTVHAWWFNPQTGETTDLSTFANSGTQTFTPADRNDWVLVLDLESANLPAPGSSAL